MAIIEDVLKSNPLAAAGIALAALAAPAFVPSLRPQLAALAKSCTKLFLEAEFGAEGEIIDHMADKAVDDMTEALAKSDPDKRRRAVHSITDKFKASAHARSQRKGWDDNDRKARYRRHISKLHDAVVALRTKQTGFNQQLLSDLLAEIR